ncbi:MAG TPA: MarR family transcriptional regulator [Rhizomicrobium sp.]|jgi:DNA-binding MarR family transcriptional regulator|nr:MarR family transcriptional regulator [Rhizomicrobium sp.]
MTRKSLDSATAEFVQAISLLVRRIRAAASTHELSLTESSVLGRLAKDGPMTIAALARAEAVRPQSMGTTVAALEEMGLLERAPHPTDGRQMNIALTAEGAAVRESRKDAKLAWLIQAVSQLSAEERQTLFDAGKILNRLVEL